MLDFIEETLDQVALFIEMGIIFTLFFPILTRWDHDLRLFFEDNLDETIRIIGSIRNHPLKFQVCYQLFRLSNVVPLSAGQNKAQWIAQSINIRMDFCREPSSASA
jgi:hypothetical protein